MSADITMPQLSDTMTEGTLVKWLKKEGDQVKSGEKIAEVETDKAVMEMEVVRRRGRGRAGRARGPEGGGRVACWR